MREAPERRSEMRDIKDLKMKNGMSCDARQSQMQAIAAAVRTMVREGKSAQEVAKLLDLRQEDVRRCMN